MSGFEQGEAAAALLQAACKCDSAQSTPDNGRFEHGRTSADALQGRCKRVLQEACKFLPANDVSFQTSLDFASGLAHLIMMSDESDLLAANAAFYAAFAAGDFAALAALWADRDSISCIHPGWSPIIGRGAVIGTWRDIINNPGRPQIVCADPYAIVDGDHGHVLCIELVDGAALAAANHFARIGGVWRMVHHQSGAIAQLTSAHYDPDSHRLH